MANTICAVCGATRPEQARFCDACGASNPGQPEPALATCASCGTELPPGAIFCDACGAPVETAKAARRARRAHSRLIFIAGGGGAVIAVAVVVAGLVLFMGGSDNEGTAPGGDPTVTQSPSRTVGVTSTAAIRPTGEASASPQPSTTASPSPSQAPAETPSGTVMPTPATATVVAPTPSTVAPPPNPTNTPAPEPTATFTPTVTATSTQATQTRLTGALGLLTGEGSLPAGDGYPLVFSGPSGAITAHTTNGTYSISLPAGTYAVSDGYADFGCANTPVVTPATVQVSGTTQAQNFTTLGCILLSRARTRAGLRLPAPEPATNGQGCIRPDQRT